jgi:hypothetical protein
MLRQGECDCGDPELTGENHSSIHEVKKTAGGLPTNRRFMYEDGSDGTDITFTSHCRTHHEK